MNGDNSGGGGNDLIYIPRNQVRLYYWRLPIRMELYMLAEQWSDLNTFINQDVYLRKEGSVYMKGMEDIGLGLAS
jgi:hypothetical protein